MKIIFDKKKMLDKLTPAMSAASNKNTFSTIEGVLIEADTDTYFRISTFDMEKGVRAEIDGQVLERGSYIINAQKLYQIIKVMPSERITLTVDEKLNATITCGTASFSLHALNGSEFPSFPEMNSIEKIVIKQSTLKNIINKTSFAIAADDHRPMLCGGFFKIENKTITTIACDSYTFAKYEVDCDSDAQISFIVPGRSLSELQKILSDSDDTAEISLSRKHIVVNLNNLMFFSRLIDSEYIDYMKIIPTRYETEVEINKHDFIESLERASLVSEDKAISGMKSFVKCSFEDNLLKLSSTSVNGKVYEEIACEINGQPIAIGFNCRYLLETLRTASTDKVKLKLISPLMSMTVFPSDEEADENNRFIYLVLPVRME
jgi:DNA polymerase-3 subunit beta